MKKLIISVVVLVCQFSGYSQSQEIQQLLLNVEKLAQFKEILNSMYTGYKVLDKGYSAIKDISAGSFDLHRTFLDGLLQVNPVVRQYKRIGDITGLQIRIVKDYKTALSAFKAEKNFSTNEIEYISRVYGNLFETSIKSLEELALVLSAGKLRMSDDERLKSIDNIYEKVLDQYSFLQEFTMSTTILAMQRQKDKLEIEQSRKINAID